MLTSVRMVNSMSKRYFTLKFSISRMFITESGKVYACGWGADGQTGLGTYENQGVPAPVKGDITSEKIVKVASTVDCVLALNGKCFINRSIFFMNIILTSSTHFSYLHKFIRALTQHNTLLCICSNTFSLV